MVDSSAGARLLQLTVQFTVTASASAPSYLPRPIDGAPQGAGHHAHLLDLAGQGVYLGSLPVP